MKRNDVQNVVNVSVWSKVDLIRRGIHEKIKDKNSNDVYEQIFNKVEAGVFDTVIGKVFEPIAPKLQLR